MTRINVICPSRLSQKMLCAEYHEITRLPNNLQKSLNRKSKPFCMSEIPLQYTLGKGHVKHFYNKMLFLQKRYEQLVQEMLARGYKPKFTDSSMFAKCPKEFYNDYTPTEEAIGINLVRIAERSGQLSGISG